MPKAETLLKGIMIRWHRNYVKCLLKFCPHCGHPLPSDCKIEGKEEGNWVDFEAALFPSTWHVQKVAFSVHPHSKL